MYIVKTKPSTGSHSCVTGKKVNATLVKSEGVWLEKIQAMIP